MCTMVAVDVERQFALICTALDPLWDRLRPLFASGNRSLILLLWQQDLNAIVRFVSECFDYALVFQIKLK